MRYVYLIALTLFLTTSVVAQQASSELDTDTKTEDEMTAKEDLLSARISAERQARTNPFIITQHRANYILPASYMDSPNDEVYSQFGLNEVNDFEVKYQLSVKLPLWSPSGSDFSGLYGAFTIQSWWQLYSDDVSSPFRETNYEPELYYSWTPDWSWEGFDVLTVDFGFNHQSNGRSQAISRSWNRLVLGSMIDHGEFFSRVRLWYRIPEEEKEDLSLAEGDDNPDITHYLGNFDWMLGTNVGDFDLTLLVRNNLDIDDNKGYGEFNLSYPIPGSDRWEILFQASTGYGDSLIDYNHYMTRYSLGVKLASF